jgi:hypothetical protein
MISNKTPSIVFDLVTSVEQLHCILKFWYITDEINRTRVTGRELQLKYREMPEKEARFN